MVLIPLVLVVLLLAAVVVVPGLIDWNEYKSEAQALVKDATGRDLVIGGDIKLTLLPAPALTAADVRLANTQGATDPDMVTLQELEVRIKAAPLLGGEIQVESVRLINPMISLERLADGRWNWAFETAEDQAQNPAIETAENGQPAAALATDSLPGVQLDSFLIRNGTVILRDAQAGTEHRIDGIDAEIKAASLIGPFEARGALRTQGIPLAFSASTSKAIHGRTLTFSTALDLGNKAAQAQISGTLLNLDETPGIKAKIHVEGDKFSNLMRLFGGKGPLPGALAQSFQIQARVEAAADKAEVPELTIGLGPVKAEGTIVATLGEQTAVDMRLALPHVDLDKMLALPRESAAAAQSNPADTPTKATVALQAQPVAAEPTSAIVLPTDLNATVELTIEALTFRDGLIRQARASGALAEGAITIDQVSALLPGSSEVALFGFVNFPEGQPRFEGSLDGMVADLRGVMNWLDIPVPPVSPDRLRKLTLSTQVLASTDEVQLPGLDITLDSSHLTGGVTVALRDRLAFGADLELDRLNLDAYLPSNEAASPAPPAQAPAQATTDGGIVRTDKQSPSGAGPDLSSLSTIDANLKARVKALTFRKQPVRDLVIDGTLYQGALTLRQASIKDLAGASAHMNGTIKNLNAIPVLKDLAFDIGARNAEGLFQLTGIQPPMPPAQLGQISLVGTANGALTSPTLDLTAKAAEATFKTAGKVKILSLTPGYEGDLSISHASLSGLLDRLNLGYRPGGAVGALDLTTKVKANTQTVLLEDLSLKAGEAAIGGKARVDLSGLRPKLAAQLTAGDLVLDPFLPAEGRKKAGLFMRNRFAALGRTATPAATGKGGAPWPTEPLDLSALGLLDADIDLSANSLVMDAYRVDGLQLVAALAGGKLDTPKLAGTLFGGALNGRLVADVNGPQPRLGLDMTVANLDIAQALIASQGAAKGSGKVDLTTALTASGGSVDGLIRGLNGNGKLALKGIDSKDGAEVDLPLIGAVLKLAKTLDGGLGGLTGALGGSKSKGLLDATGDFTISNGVVSMPALALRTTAYQGNTKLILDLPGYTMAADGTLSLTQNLVGALLSQIKEVPKSIPFSVSGPLNNPTNVKVDTGSQPGGKLTLPGKLGKGKAGTLLQQVLPGLLGGGTAQPSTPSPAPAPPAADGSLPPPPPPPSGSPSSGSGKPKAEDLIRGILGGLGR
ncbi:AsmA family protein [Magnetospira sp. QH-2]|uniref:AsmA family protein n=1 Tax=Magnetospira sp. (strain QH-2) TaxID=1288970 RepID=UPI00208DFB74|nr:AsmA family protein [Magnetospira sp. QH-2]